MIIVLGYCRVSTDAQAIDGHSLGAQQGAIAQYCLAHSLPAPEWVVDKAVSGGKALRERPAGKRLFAPGVEHVVVTKLDRLFRSTSDALATLAEWTEAGVVVHILDMGGSAVSTGSAIGKFMLTIMSAFAELERALVSERTSAVTKHLKSNGRVYGQVPYGYRREGRRLVADEHEQMILARMSRLRDIVGVSYKGIARDLHAIGLVPRKGKWYASTIRKILERKQI